MMYIYRVLGVTLFCPHARTSHLTTFARTHFARTRAFYPVALRTRTRTSKFSKDEMELKVQRQVHRGGINRLFILRPKHYFYYFYKILQQ